MPKRPPNLLIFAIDSIRRDHMSCYGYPRLTTPHMDRLAERGVQFDNAFSAYIPTTSAYVSMLTGRDVIATQQVALSPLGPMAKDQPTLPELLKPAGYRSIMVGHGKWYRGFDKYLDYASWGGPWEERPSRKAESLNDAVLPELERLHVSGKPWMLYLRHMDPHSPYYPPPPYDSLFYSKNPCSTKLPNTMKAVRDFKPFADYILSWLPPGIRDADFVTAQYDGALAYMDACIQRLVTRVEELGIAADTLIVITGDHGETLYEHECSLGHPGGFLERLREGTLAGHVVEHVALDVLGRIELRFLAQVAGGEAGRQARLTGEPVVEPGHDPQEARLPRPVRTDETADLAGFDLQVVVEYGPQSAEVVCHLVDMKQCHPTPLFPFSFSVSGDCGRQTP